MYYMKDSTKSLPCKLSQVYNVFIDCKLCSLRGIIVMQCSVCFKRSYDHLLAQKCINCDIIVVNFYHSDIVTAMLKWIGAYLLESI